MTDINPSNQRHRPPPLTTDQRPPASDRAQMLQGLRTARPSPLPVSSPNLSALQQAQADYLQQLQLQIQQQSQMLLMQQQQQSEVAFREMQRRAAARDQQQQQGGRASQQRSSSVEPQRRLQQVYAEPPRSAVVGGSFLSPEEEEAATTNSKTNPLVASALARRKRQSLNAEAMGALQNQGGAGGGGRERRISSGPADVVHHRQSSSETTASSVSAQTSPPSSVSARTPPASADPPALILSKPGEAYPSASGSEDDDDDSTSSIKSKPIARCYSVHTAADLTSPKASSSGSNSPDLSAEAQDAVAAKPTRRSHVSDLNLALGGRKQRPASIGGAIGLGSPQLAGGFGDTPRASSDSHAPALSPFATTFTPLPPSPYFPSPAFDTQHMSFASPPLAGGGAFSPQMFSPAMNAFSPSMNAFSPNMSTPFSPNSNAYQSNKPAAVAGTASAIRQPRGPAAELAGNFSSRLRRRAVATLLGSRGVGRVSLGGGGEGEGGAVMGLGVDVAGAEDE